MIDSAVIYNNKFVKCVLIVREPLKLIDSASEFFRVLIELIPLFVISVI